MDDSISESDKEQSEVRACPVKDCILSIDIILQSSDGIQFGTHLINLQQYSEGFPLAESVSVDTDVPVLEETADVLEIMLQFMHHTRQPSLSTMEFNLLSALSEAVEKYMVFSAMGVCNVYMGLKVEDHPTDVLIYSVKHDYPELANKAAPLTLSAESEIMVKKAKASRLHDSFLVTWFRYHDIHAKVGRSLLKRPPPPGSGGLHKGGIEDCGLWEPYTKDVVLASVEKDFAGPKEIEDIISIYDYSITSCSHCSKRADMWRRQARSGYADIPLFSGM